VNSSFNFFLLLFSGLSIGFDVYQRRIPNWLVLTGAVGGIAFSLNEGGLSLYDSLLGLVLGIAILFIPFALGWLGAGDVKLLGAMGALLGVSSLPRVFFYTALSGMVLALVSILLRGINWSVFQGTWRDFKLLVVSGGQIKPPTVTERVAAGNHALPYGVAIALGALVAFYGDPNGKWAGF
jgi:prepilin peptidase CpaA